MYLYVEMAANTTYVVIKNNIITSMFIYISMDNVNYHKQ